MIASGTVPFTVTASRLRLPVKEISAILLLGGTASRLVDDLHVGGCGRQSQSRRGTFGHGSELALALRKQADVYQNMSGYALDAGRGLPGTSLAPPGIEGESSIGLETVRQTRIAGRDQDQISVESAASVDRASGEDARVNLKSGPSSENAVPSISSFVVEAAMKNCCSLNW